MNAEIIAIGDEITSGQLLDTNTQWLSQRIEEMGIRVLYHTTVGDELEPCTDVFRRAIERAELIVVTGGLGPTADDLTRETIAEATDRPLQFNEEALRHIERLFAGRNRKMPERNKQQAYFPAGAQVIHNPNGTAPGIDLTIERPEQLTGRGPCRLFALPGVPAEMREMWEASVGGAINEFGGGQRIIRRKRINCFGAGESQIEEMLPDMIRRGRQPTVGITASQASIILRIVAEGSTEADCNAAIGPTEATIRERLGTLVYGEDDEQLQDAIVGLLQRQRKTFATVEWGTTGLVAQWFNNAWFNNATDAQHVYRGGLVVPNENALKRVLGVDSAAGAELARAMAAGCRERFDTDYALAIGRFPRFDPTLAEPETVFFALATPERVAVKETPFVGHPALLKVLYAKRALNMVRLALLKRGE